MTINNKVQLITYPDSMGGDLKSLNHLLLKHFRGAFAGGVHLLPPFPSTGDRGFAPRTYFEIDPAFGTWEDVRKIGENFDVVVDLMVNHMSRQSEQFQDFERRGRTSPQADLFLTIDKVWPGGNPPAEDVAKIFLRRPKTPFLDITIQETGETERVWATFGAADWSEQMDLDLYSPATRQLIADTLAHFAQNGVKIVRLDAVGYVVKKAGTSCFMVEPEIWDVLAWLKEQADAVGIALLLEVHAPNDQQAEIEARGYWVYNYVFPLLVLHTLFHQSSRTLREYLQICPRRQFTMLDCHDGIPVQPDLDGILEIDEAQGVVQVLEARGANLNRILSAEHLKRPDFVAHQVNCTYFSAVGSDPDAYLAARAIQFFAPGVPQVYYVGALAGENTPEEVARQAENRAINRYNYSVEEVEAAVQQPVVQRLLELMRFRNTHPAFDGDFAVLDSPDDQLVLRWQQGAQHCTLTVDLPTSRASIAFTDADGAVREYTP